MLTKLDAMNAMTTNEEEMDKISDDESTNYFTSDEEELQMENIEAEQIKMNKYEQRIYNLCQQNFEGKEIVMAKHNDIVADTNKIYILKRKKNEKISSISRDGYLYQSNTSRKQMPQILHNQGYSYSYQCNGKLVCYNSDCPVLNRLTVLNSFQYKKSSPNKCRFCKSDLQWEECEGQKYVLRSKDTDEASSKSNYLIIKYVQLHSCGNPEPILNQNVADELKTLFENNPELTPSHAYKSLLEKKIREKKSYKEILSVVQAFTFDYKAKNIKANVKKDLNGNGDDLACMLELQKFLSEMPELELVLKVYTDSYICASCDSYTLAETLDESLKTKCENEKCEHVKTEMQHPGPIILLTSSDQIRTAEQMTAQDGAFHYSTLYLDHQNNRVVNFNTFNAFIYDFHVQSISSIFTVHSKLEDRYSINLSFKLFDEVYKNVLETDNGFKPHGFSSDNAGAISAGLRMHFGTDILHRTCSFHYLYGAYMHCCNAVGERSSQIQFLRFAWKLLEAATPNKFELLYKLFVKWIQKTDSRQKKLKPWLKFWYDRKTQWATAYTSLSVNNVNLSEAGQSKYRINNGLKRLKLYQGCVYELGDFLLYSSRIKAMASQNFVGKGPSREILDLRESRKAMERIKDHFMTKNDLDELYAYLGIITKKKKNSSRKGSSRPTKKRPFVSADIEDIEIALKKFKPDPKAPYTYKTPKIKDPLSSKKPGRPAGSKKKRPNRNESFSSETSLEMTDVEDSDFFEEDFIVPETNEDPPTNKTGRKLRKRKHRTDLENETSLNRSSKRIKRVKEIENSSSKIDEIASEEMEENRKDKNYEVKELFEDDDPGNAKKQKEETRNYKCSKCEAASKSVQGVRAHYIVDHVWKNFENSPIMKDSIENLSHIFVVNRNGKLKCVCGTVCPDIIYKGHEDDAEDDQEGRQWVQVHRLVSPNHYKPSKTHRFNDVFPADLVVYKGCPWNASLDATEDEEPVDVVTDVNSINEVEGNSESDNDSLPDIDKYSRKVTFKANDDDEKIELFSSEESSSDEELQREPISKSNSKHKARKDRKKDTKAFRNLRKRARAEAKDYTIRLKCEKNSSFTFEIMKTTNNTEPYTVTFGEMDVTCNCKSFKEIEERRHNAANEVCKHAALVTLYCHENLRENFNGQRWFSTRSAFRRVSDMLKSFDASRNIFEKQKHPNYFLYPAPIPNPTRKFPYYKKKEYALNQLTKLPAPKWIAETYNRETNKGDKPACKSCTKKMALGNLCLRVDYTSLFINRNFKKDEFSLKMSPFRICMKVSCFNDLITKIHPKRKYREETNLPVINSIDLRNIFDDDKATVQNVFKNEDVPLIYS